MPTAKTRLEQLQVRKLLSCVLKEDKKQIEKLIEYGIPNLLNYIEESEEGQGICMLNQCVIIENQKKWR